MCGADQIARGVLGSLRDRGLDVPGAVAIASFDNWTILAAESRPRTSVDMNVEQLDRLAAERLFQRMNGKAQTGVETLPCRLVIRGSTVAG